MQYLTHSLPQILQARSREHGDALAFRFLADGTSDQAINWTYRDLAAHAGIVAADLVAAGSQRMVLAVDPGLHYVAALFGALAAGVTVVPSFPPAGRRATSQFLSIVDDCSADVVAVSENQSAAAQTLAAELPPARRPRWLLTGDAFFDRPFDSASIRVRPRDPALLQYTSGSTGDPKGIVLTHDNLLSNCRTLREHMGVTGGQLGVSWLPPYHDMGLMGTIMMAVYTGWPLVMMSPVHFVQQPYRWLKAITDHGATIAVAPNFAFDMCADTITDDEIETLDLSKLRLLFCGAEPVSKTTLDRFRDRFSACGYRESALLPCYGLAEATLFVTGKPGRQTLRSAWLDKAALEQGTAKLTPSRSEAATEVVSCGTPALGHSVVVADPESGRPLPPGSVGEIWVSGRNVARGYHSKPGLTAEVFAARLDGAEDGPRYLRTGDAGFLLDGELFVTGRLKDVIIIAGRNLYPQDIEASTVAAHEDLCRAAAFSIRPSGGEEELVVVAELRRAWRRTEADLAAVRDAVVAAVTAGHAVGPASLHLGPPGTIPTTTSGKVRRSATRLAYEQGTLTALTPARAAQEPALAGGGA